MVSEASLVPTKVSQGSRQPGPVGGTDPKGGAADFTRSGSGSSPASSSRSARRSRGEVPISRKLNPRYEVSLSENDASALLGRTRAPDAERNVIAPSRVRKSS